jgi:hypothetical protein
MQSTAFKAALILVVGPILLLTLHVGVLGKSVVFIHLWREITH